jgi:hypothetical protein
MAERLRSLSAAELEARLRAVGRDIDAPSATRIARAVGERIRSLPEQAGATPRPVPLARRRSTLLLVAAALLLLAAIAAAARLSIGSVTIRGEPSPTSVPSARETVALGRPTSLEAASAELGARLPRPVALGVPDEVFVDHPTASDVRVSMAWRPRPGLPRIPGLPWGAALWVFRGDADVATKVLFHDADALESAGRASVNGAPAFWIPAPHELDVLTSDGPRSVLITGNALLWEHGDVTLRLETSLPKAQAVRIAESVRAEP